MTVLAPPAVAMPQGADTPDRAPAGPTPRQRYESQVLCHLDDLYGAAIRMTHDPTSAEDLVQETVLRAWKAWDRFRQGTNARAWIFRILVNTFINGYRRKRTERDFLDSRRPGTMADKHFTREALESWSNPARAYEHRTLSPVVQEALASLNPEFRAVVVLADLRDFSYREIAEAMSCPIGTVMSRLFRARRILRTMLYEHARAHGLRAMG